MYREKKAHAILGTCSPTLAKLMASLPVVHTRTQVVCPPIFPAIVEPVD